MSGDSVCVNDATVDLDSTKVYTYCGNCKGVRDLIDKHNALKKTHQTCLKLNEILAQKVWLLERQLRSPQGGVFAPLPSWDEEQERAGFVRFMDSICQETSKCLIEDSPDLDKISCPGSKS